MAEPFPLAPSLWATTAAPAPETPPLVESGRADVVIVGGGFCGLSTALHLAERGIRPVVLEAHEIGFGGSGRNGGQVIPGLKHDPADLIARFGRERGERLARFAGGTTDTVFDLIARHGMDVPHRREGWIQGAHTEAGLDDVARRARQWADLGAPARVLDKDETDRLLGTDRYLGGWLDGRGGAIQPLSYARGLARAALKAGAAIHGGSPVTALDRTGSGWTVTTAQGARLATERVVLCTNGYTGGLWPDLAQTVIAANSFQVATVPLSDNLRRSILPEGQVSSDTRKLLLYFRLDHTGRLLMGGRGPFREPRGPQDWAHLERIVGKLFPQLDGIAFEHRWCGHVAITRDYLPHLHEPAPGLLIDIGCQGRGGPSVGDGPGDRRLHRDRRCRQPAPAAHADRAAAAPRAAPPVRLRDHRLVSLERRRHSLTDRATSGDRSAAVETNARLSRATCACGLIHTERLDCRRMRFRNPAAIG